MSRITGKNTKPEILVRKALFKNGFRFRIHVKNLPGKPDIVLPKYKAIIFINGCFWHGHENCKKSKLPQTNTEFWTKKIDINVIRDKISMNKLSELGWKIIVIWQCELTKKLFDQSIKSLIGNIKCNISSTPTKTIN